MVTKLMDYCNNHFLVSAESPEMTFNDTSSVYTIEGDFNDTYLVGQYVYICGSILNDGAYKITEIATGVLTVSTQLYTESTTDTSRTVYIYGCAVPRGFVELASDIDTWNTNNKNDIGLVSEKIDDYSKQKQQGSNGKGFTWKDAFSTELEDYKALYDDIGRYYHGYN